MFKQSQQDDIFDDLYTYVERLYNTLSHKAVLGCITTTEAELLASASSLLADIKTQ